VLLLRCRKRELTWFAAMLVKGGAEVLRCAGVPFTMRLISKPVLDWIADFIGTRT